MPEEIVTAAPAVAPAPATTPAPSGVTAPVVPAVEPKAPAKAEPVKDARLLSKKEAQAQGLKLANERLAKLNEPKTEPAKVEPAKTETPAPTGEAAKTEPAPAPGEAKPETPPAAGIKIELDQNHPALGGRKIQSITVSTPQEEQVVRALLNGSYFRRQDVERRDARITQLETENRDIQLKLLQRESHESARSDWEKSPGYQETLESYYKIKETQGDKAAAAFWRGAQIDFQNAAQTKYTESLSEIEAQDNQRHAETWTQEAMENTESWLPEIIRTIPDYRRWFAEAVQSFDSEISLGHFPDVQDSASMHKAFVPFFQAKLMAQQSVRDVLSRARQQEEQGKTSAASAAQAEQQRIAAIEKAAIEKYLKAEADKRAATPPSPLGNLAAASRSRAVGEQPEPENAQAPVTPYQAKRNAKEAARQMVRQRFGQ